MKKTWLPALGAGMLFGLGLAMSGMTDARRVLGFLDVAGAFDPTLLFVLGGAVVTTTIAFRFVLARPRPIFAEAFRLPAATRVDVVYYVRYDDRIKIGTSASPRQRLAAIWHHELLAFERGDRTVERRRHEQFAADRYPRTEWFRRSSALEAHIAGLAAGVGDPWELHARWVSEAAARLG